MKAKLIKFSIVGTLAIFDKDDECIGEKNSNALIFYYAEEIDLKKIGKELEQIIEQKYATEEAQSK